MKTVFVLARLIEKYVGKGDPNHRIEWMPTCKAVGDWNLGPGEPSPVFTSRELADQFKAEHDDIGWWSVIEVELVESEQGN